VKEPQRIFGDDSTMTVHWNTTTDFWMAMSKPSGQPL